MSNDTLPSFLAQLSETEQQFLSGKRDQSADLESAVRIFLEFLRGFEFFGNIDRPCVTVSAPRDLHPVIATTGWRASNSPRSARTRSLFANR